VGIGGSSMCVVVLCASSVNSALGQRCSLVMVVYALRAHAPEVVCTACVEMHAGAANSRAKNVYSTVKCMVCAFVVLVL
jgi:hypothetical protein